MSMWFARYRWLFLVGTVVILGFAYYRAYSNQKRRSLEQDGFARSHGLELGDDRLYLAG